MESQLTALEHKIDDLLASVDKQSRESEAPSDSNESEKCVKATEDVK